MPAEGYIRGFSNVFKTLAEKCKLAHFKDWGNAVLSLYWRAAYRHGPKYFEGS
jgi:hypothetical protein